MLSFRVSVLQLLTIIYLLSGVCDAATLDKLSRENKIFDDAIEQNEVNEIEENNLIYEFDTNSTTLSSIEVEEEKRKRFFSKSDSTALGMDSLTIIWYLTTFTALFGFFIVMACTENSCQRRRTIKPPDARTSPPTPCPSYKNFAPPSYGSVMKKLKNQKIFVVPVHEGNNNFFNDPHQVPNDIAQTPTATNQTSVDIEKNEA